MRIALAGGGHLALCLLRALLGSSHEMVALVQDGRHTRGLKRLLDPVTATIAGPHRSVKGLARAHKLPFIYIDKMNDRELAPLRKLEPDILLVGGFAIILKKPIITLPTIGCVNTHSSLLPKHRGPNPFTAVLLANETETGVTFHVVDEKIDTGDILAQFPFPIEPADTAGMIHNRAAELAGEHVVDLMDRIAAEGVHGSPQDPALATYEKKLKKKELYIDWNQPAVDVERFVRANFPFVLARFRYADKNVYVSKAAADPAPVDAAPGSVVAVRPAVRIATGKGTFTPYQAFSMKPFPWRWPRPLTKIQPGDKVE
jgi:methionyl-tRNA formyltransferase